MLMRTIIAFLAVLAGTAVMAQAYRWVDEDGVVHYSDRPQAGAEQIVLPQSNEPTRSRGAYRPPTGPQSAAASGDQSDEAAGPFSYETIEIVAPAPEETLWNIGGVLNVSISITPALRPGDQVRVYFDGEPRMVSGSSFQIEEVWRGVHNIQAEVLEAGTGRLMGRSLTNRFYVQQTSVARAN